MLFRHKLGVETSNNPFIMYFFNFIKWNMYWTPLCFGTALDLGITQVHKTDSLSLRILESSIGEQSWTFWLRKEIVEQNLDNQKPMFCSTN